MVNQDIMEKVYITLSYKAKNGNMILWQNFLFSKTPLSTTVSINVPK